MVCRIGQLDEGWISYSSNVGRNALRCDKGMKKDSQISSIAFIATMSRVLYTLLSMATRNSRHCSGPVLTTEYRLPVISRNAQPSHILFVLLSTSHHTPNVPHLSQRRPAPFDTPLRKSQSNGAISQVSMILTQKEIGPTLESDMHRHVNNTLSQEAPFHSPAIKQYMPISKPVCCPCSCEISCPNVTPDP